MTPRTRTPSRAAVTGSPSLRSSSSSGPG
jgi:hypothetical protein